MDSKTVIKKEDLVFQEDVYEKCLKAFQIAEEYLGVRIQVHGKDSSLEDGQIFLFNHFARFETVIPGYIFYKRMGKFTRTIADYELFNYEKLSRFLRGVGAVPNNMPGLLPFLASEILKGHKVVIFPEGSMVKDKQVMDASGQFSVFSPRLKTYRKHHTGAAVLALTLDMFKQRIKHLFETGEVGRLDNWCEALEFESHEALRESVEKPTLIVPGTITFSPIRISDNFVSRTVQLLTKEISNRVLDEIIIEGNILLKDTDMDIRFGEPIKAVHKWTWLDKRLLDSYFVSIKSLDEFFSLKDRSESWSERLLAYFIYKETQNLRDKYIAGMYRGLTINIAHIASVLIFTYLESGRMVIPRDEVHRTLYMAVKELQKEPDIHMHSSLTEPDNYQFLYLGKSPRFDQFLETALQAELIEVTDDSYHLLDKLSEDQGFNTVRLQNPLTVSANEAAPIPQIREAVTKAIEDVRSGDLIPFSSNLWDDEINSFAWEKEKFNGPEYRKINQHETSYRSREPYLLTYKGKTKIGVLLVHGLLASPGELKPYGQHIHKRGFNVLGVRLAGHGTSPADLHTRDWEEWLASVRRGYQILSAFADEIIIVGFSVGGTLSLRFASEKPDKLKAVITVCSAIRIRSKGIHFAKLVATVSSAVHVSKLERSMNYRPSDTVHGDTNYRSIPVRALAELKELMAQTQKKLPDVTAPIMVLQSKDDTIVDPDSATMILDNIGSETRKLQWIDTDNHHIIRENVGGTWALLDAYIEHQAIDQNLTKELEHVANS